MIWLSQAGFGAQRLCLDQTLQAGSLVKATTLPAFILAGGVIVEVNLWHDSDYRKLKRGISWTRLVPVARRYFLWYLRP